MALQRLENLILAGSGSTTPAEALAALGTPSTSIALLENGNISSVCHSTVGDNEDTVFQACSISKPITALAILRLIELGHFTLDSTISQLLPADVLNVLVEGSPASQKAIVEQITVEQLMSHTAGLSVHGFGGYASWGKDLSGKDVLLAQPPVNSLRVRLELLPGSTFSYSGGGITVLQIILETVTRKPFPKILQDVVLGPLSMNRSFYGHLPNDEINAASAYKTGYVKSDVPHHIYPELAAAGLWTTPTDLLKAVRAVQQSLAGDGFLKQATVKDMLTKRKSNMGLSWFVSENGTDFSHSGSNDPGFRCQVFGFAKLGDMAVPENCGVAIMTNSQEGERMLALVGDALCYLNNWPRAPVLSCRVPYTPFWDNKALLGEFWKDYAGEWKDESKSVYKIAEDDGELALYYNGSGPIRMLPGATPGSQNEAGDTVRFVLEGFKLVLRLGEKDGKRVITVENGERGDSSDLERVARSSG